jgi:hypothetical protein
MSVSREFVPPMRKPAPQYRQMVSASLTTRPSANLDFHDPDTALHSTDEISDGELVGRSDATSGVPEAERASMSELSALAKLTRASLRPPTRVSSGRASGPPFASVVFFRNAACGAPSCRGSRRNTRRRCKNLRPDSTFHPGFRASQQRPDCPSRKPPACRQIRVP